MAKPKRKLTTEQLSASKNKKQRASKESDVTAKENRSEDDEISIQIKQEKMKALEILDSILGSINTGDCADERPHQHESSGGNKGSRSNKLEICCKSASNDGHNNEISKTVVRGQTELDKKIPPEEKEDPTTNHSYTTDTNLKQLFGSSGSGDNGVFKFLSESEGTTKTELNETKTTSPKQPEQLLPPQIEGSDSTEENEPLTSKSNLFFFHSKNKALKNRLEENTFYRTKTMEELEQAWPNRRTTMWQSFKRRKRDAVRLGRKKKQQRYNREKD